MYIWIFWGACGRMFLLFYIFYIFSIYSFSYYSFVPSTYVKGLLFSWPWAGSPSLLDFLFSDPPGTLAIIVFDCGWPLLNKRLRRERVFWKPIITTQRYLYIYICIYTNYTISSFSISIVYPSNKTRMNFIQLAKWSVNQGASFCFF